MKKIIIIFMMFIISSCSYYGKVNEKGERVTVFENENTVQENTERDEVIEKIQENTIDEVVSVVEKDESITKDENKVNIANQKEEQKDKNTNKNSGIQETKEKQDKIKNDEKNSKTQTNINSNNNEKETIDTNMDQEKNTNNVQKCTHSNDNWYASKAEAEAIYNAKIKEWGDKWTNYEIDNETYYKNCPSGYEVFSCPYCNKWTINLFY